MKIKLFAILVVSLSVTFFAKADFSLQQWQYQKEIHVEKDGLIDVTLDNDVFANAAKGLSDVRLVNSNNQEIPYKLIATMGEDNVKDYFPRMINNSITPGNYSSVILDLEQQGIITNSLTVNTPSENFQRNLKVYGSNNQSDWNELKSNGYIYDYTDKRGGIKSQNTTVLFPDSVFKFLKVEISDVDNKPIIISSIKVSQQVKKNTQEFELSPSVEINQDTANKTTTILADLRQSGIPTSKILLAVRDKNFNRGVLVYSGSDKNTLNWKSVGQGYIFRYDTPKFVGENTTLSIGETSDRFLKIVVFNNDNVPLDLSQIKTFAAYRELVFQAQGEKSFSLFYGNKNAKTPQYDIEKYFQYLDLASAQKVTLGTQKVNPQYLTESLPEKPITERYPYFLTIALSTAGIILLLMVYKFLKKA
jgi:hypothetical protein